MNEQQTKFTDAKIGELLSNGTPQAQIAAETGLTPAKISTLKQQYLNAYLLDVEQKKHQATKVQLSNANAKAVTAEALRNENEQLKQQVGTLKAAKTKLQLTDTELQDVSAKLQVSETNLQEALRRLQQSETNLQEVSEKLQQSETKLQEVASNETELAKHLQVTDAKLQDVTGKLQQSETNLQAVTTKLQHAHQQLQLQKKPIKEQKVLTHPRFLLWAIIGFEGYNAWQLFSNMQLQMFPFVMALVFASFFGLASVTALAANHRWGVWVCVASAFISNAIHADLFTSPSLAGGFYTLLPCVLILLFADMYKNKNIS